MAPAEVSTSGPGLERHSPLDDRELVHIDIICHNAGLTTAAYSFGYVAHWSGGDPANVKTTAERVVTTARTILDRIGLHTEPAHIPEGVAA